MIKRSIEISQNPAHVCLQNDQILLKRGDAIIGAIPSEDLGILVVDHPQATFSAAALARIAEQGGVVVVCDRSHLPNAAILPYSKHSLVVSRLDQQIEATLPRKKRIWQDVVAAKIHAQASLLDTKSYPFRKLKSLASQVKSGDSSAVEGQAARIYWANWLTSHLPIDESKPLPGEEPGYDKPHIAPRFLEDTTRTETYDDQPDLVIPELGEPIGTPGQKLSEIDLVTTARQFRRNPDAAGLNAFLNYGYAILRAVTARAIVSAGLNPALGIKHSNRGNPFCLADDLMEPLRPVIDRRVRMLWCELGKRTLDPQTKTILLESLTESIKFKGETGPLMVVMSRYVNSFLRALTGENEKILIPKMLD